MKEIKFKAKRKDNNEWTYGYLEKQAVKGEEYYITSPCNEWINNCHIVIPETISQYTGLKDKNGVEIYENDIISATEHLTNGYIGIGEVDLYYEVNYIDRLSKYALNPRIINGKYNSNNFELDMFHYKAEDIEVIGNIFDNSELLEKSDKDE